MLTRPDAVVSWLPPGVTDADRLPGRHPAFLVEAARRYAEDLEIEPVVVAAARAGIADAEAGHHVTIAGPEDAEALHQRTMRRLGEQLAAELLPRAARQAQRAAPE